MSSAAVCLCLLCGLPAVGKSSLAQVLQGRVKSRGWEALVVTYDALIPRRDWRETEWKHHRKKVMMCLEKFLQTHTDQTNTHADQTNTHADQIHTHSDQTNAHFDQTQTNFDQTNTHSHQTHTHSESDEDIWIRCDQNISETRPLIVLLDDNFYYSSMRYEVYQLARKYGVGFCQVFLTCPLDVSLWRNRQRSERVPDEVLMKMSTRMDPPNSTRNPWEQKSLTLDTTERISDGELKKLMDLLVLALEDPLSPMQDDSQQKEADRQICASSLLHQADQTCRRLISQAMKSARDVQASSDILKVLAKELNEFKASFLLQLKTEALHRVSLCPVETLNTEKLMMDAAVAFEQHTEEIMSKHGLNTK